MSYELAEIQKTDKNQDLDCDYLYTPCAIETLGTWGLSAFSLYKSNSKKIIGSLGDTISCTSLHRYLCL